MKLSKSVQTSVALVALTVLLLGHQSLLESRVSRTSGCVDCHTNLKKLIKLCWKIEEIRSKPLTSAETSGEG